MARRKASDKKAGDQGEGVKRVQADHNSIAIGGIHFGRDLSGSFTIGYTADQVSLLLSQINTQFQPKPFSGECPYKGLEVFEEEDAGLFFGRERLVEELVGRVKESRAVFITGPSGSGKSSLVRAGLIHALKENALKSSKGWLYETMKPGREPLKDLALAFSRLKSPELADYFQAHADETDVLHKCAESVLSGREDQRFVLFVDQFEEVFTQVNQEAERVAFLRMLAHAGTVENGRVIVLFAMRSDFVSNCAAYPALNELLSGQFRQVGAMQAEELVAAIALPAKKVGLPVEPELIAQIINDMKGEPGALPLMQFALKELFEARGTKAGKIALTLEDYLGRGGIQKMLARHADATMNGLSTEQQELARSIFGGLIEIGRGRQDTRRTALFEELVPADTKTEQVEAVVQKLADARLVITDEQAGQDTVTIAHERLISAWPWLEKLIDENRDSIALQNEIASDAKEWDDHGSDPSYLYTGARLATAQEKIKNLVLSENSQAYLAASLQAEKEARWQQERTGRRILAGSISFSVIVLGLLIFSLVQLNISRAQQLGSQAQAAFAEGDFNIALLYAYQSNKIYKNNAADLVLGQIPYENYAVASPLEGDTDSGSSVAWSADGRLASGSIDNSIIIWDLKTGRPAQTLKGHKGSVLSVAWTAGGRLASGSSDGTVILWDLETGQPAQTLQGHKGSVLSVAWSTDGRLASGSEDGSVILWDLETGQPAQTLQGHTDVVTSVAWSADGRLASGSVGNTILLWNLETGEPAQTLRAHTAPVTSVTWSADGRLASGSSDGTVILWDLETGQPTQTLKGHTAPVTSVAWSADGRLASGSEDGSVILWDLKAGEPAQILKGHTYFVSSVAWATDGRLASGSSDGTVILWDLRTRGLAEILRGYTAPINSMAWSADERLAFGTVDGAVILWDFKTGKPAQTLHEHNDVVTSVAWSAAGRLASGSDDGSVIVWDLKMEQSAQTFQGHTDPVTSVAWSADGRLASGSVDNTIIIWNLKTGQPAQTLQGHKGSVLSVAWSTDGRLASGSEDGSVIVWDLKTGKPAQTLRGHISLVTSVAWSPDGRLASGSDDGTVIVWDIKTDKAAQTLQGHTSLVTSVAWSPDGRLASASADTTIRIARSDLIRGDLCQRVFRNMTVEEWQSLQGALYVYQPVCPDLPAPAFHPVNDFLNGDIQSVMLTWRGRALLLGSLALFLALLYRSFPVLRKLVSWVRNKVKNQWGKKPARI